MVVFGSFMKTLRLGVWFVLVLKIAYVVVACIVDCVLPLAPCVLTLLLSEWFPIARSLLID